MEIDDKIEDQTNKLSNKLDFKSTSLIINDESINNLHALLALLHGKSDSKSQTFSKEVTVDKLRLSTLHLNICEKLSTHSIPALITTANVLLNNRKVIDFKSWDEFESFKWENIDHSIESIVLEWDFFLKLQNFESPQRHKLTLKIHSSPLDDFIILNGEFERNNATMSCRVDFINHVLADELLNIVGDWCNLCAPALLNPKYKIFLFENKFFFAKMCQFLTILSLVFAIGIFVKICIDIPQITVAILLYALLFLVAFHFLVVTLSGYLGQFIFNKLKSLLSVHIFDITEGDKKRRLLLKQKSLSTKNAVIILFFNVFVPLILGITFYFLDHL